MAKTPLCCKNLWVLFSGNHLIKSQEYISLLLESNSEKILKGILFYDKRVENEKLITTKEVLKQQGLEDIPLYFIEKLSQLLNVNISSACQLFLSYLLHEFKGTPKNVKNLFSNENSIQTLLHSIWDHYYSERLFSLFCARQILSSWQASSKHPYYQLYYNFLTKVNADNAVLNQVIAQLTESLTAELPNRHANGHYLSDSLIYKWIESNIRETYQLLQILLLYFKNLEPSMNNILQLLSLFQENGFGTRFSFKQNPTFLAGSKVSNYIKSIGFLESLVLIECIQLDWLYKCVDQDISEHHLLKDTAKFLQLDQTIQENCTHLQQYSPILLAWMVVKSWNLPGIQSQTDANCIKNLGLSALNFNVFGYLKDCLNDDTILEIKSTQVGRVIKKVIADLLSITFSIYSIDMVGENLKVLYQLVTFILSENEVAESMFQKGNECGLMLIYLQSLQHFPLDLLSFVDMNVALAKTSCADKMLNTISSLSQLTEKFNSSLSSVVNPEGNNTYRLMVNRNVYDKSNLLIKKGTLGTLLKLSSENTIYITWKNVNINGLTVLDHIYHEKLNANYAGFAASNNESSIEELIAITHLITAIVENNLNSFVIIENLIHNNLKLFKLFCKFPTISRKLIASILNAFSIWILFNTVPSCDIWELISECALFPYMIGLTKDEKDLISGQDTNSSRIGEIIVSQECIFGNYELCCAYLNLLSISMPLNNQISCASLIHITTEIFSSYYHWHYEKMADYKFIGNKCLEIFNNILSMESKIEKERQVLVSICKTSLLSGPAGQTLLKIIVSGQDIVRQVIENNGDSQVLQNDELVIMVRLSLSVLNRLLLLQERESNQPLTNTAVEQALFFTNPTKSNMILVLSHYVFQKYDSRLATLAVTLLKRLSKHFPMSMLACLGSEGESIRDHFLYRLEEITEDLQLKIALLSFLSSCIKHQPGLIEMFLNLESSTESENGTCSCLKTVLEILEEKMLEKYYCPRDLHLAAVKFIFTFWLQPHLLAIDSLKKTSNMWKLVCFPLINLNSIDDRLLGYILRLLAREVFYCKTLERDKFDPGLEEVFRPLGEKNHLIKISNYLKNNCSKAVPVKNDIISLMSSWRDFLVSISKFEPFFIPRDMKYIIITDLLCSLSSQLQLNSDLNHSLLTILSDILMLLMNKWKREGKESFIEWCKMITDIFYAVIDKKEYLTIGFLISVSTLFNYFMKFFGEGDLLLNEHLKDWIIPWCELFSYCFQVLDKKLLTIDDGQDDNLLNLAVVILSMFEYLILSPGKISIWLITVRSNLILESMLSMLCIFIEQKKGFKLSRTLISTFTLLSTIPETANLLQTIQVIEQINSSLLKSKESFEKENKSIINIYWLKTFELTIKLANSLLVTLKHHFVTTVVDLVVNHLDEIVNCFTCIRNSPVSELIEEATHIISLLCDLTNYKQFWILHNSCSYDKLVNEISKTCNSLIAFILRPSLLQHLLTHPSLPVSFTTSSLSSSHLPLVNISKSVNESSMNDNEKISSKLCSSVEVEQQNLEVHQSLLKLLSRSLLFLHNVNPNLLEVVSLLKLNSDSIKVKVDTSIGAPNIDPNKFISFGSLLTCITLCIRMFSKVDKLCNQNEPISEQNWRKQILFTLETSLSLLVSQALLAQFSPPNLVSDREKQIIGRELKTELSSMLSVISRYTKRSISGSNIHSIPRSPGGSLLERPFIKSLIQIVEVVFK